MPLPQPPSAGSQSGVGIDPTADDSSANVGVTPPEYYDEELLRIYAWQRSFSNGAAGSSTRSLMLQPLLRQSSNTSIPADNISSKTLLYPLQQMKTENDKSFTGHQVPHFSTTPRGGSNDRMSNLQGSNIANQATLSPSFRKSCRIEIPDQAGLTSVDSHASVWQGAQQCSPLDGSADEIEKGTREPTMVETQLVESDTEETTLKPEVQRSLTIFREGVKSNGALLKKLRNRRGEHARCKTDEQLACFQTNQTLEDHVSVYYAYTTGASRGKVATWADQLEQLVADGVLSDVDWVKQLQDKIWNLRRPPKTSTEAQDDDNGNN